VPSIKQLAPPIQFAAEKAINQRLLAHIAELNHNRLNCLWEARMMEQRHEKVGRLLDRVAFPKRDKRGSVKRVEESGDRVERR